MSLPLIFWTATWIWKFYDKSNDAERVPKNIPKFEYSIKITEFYKFRFSFKFYKHFN